MKHVFATPMALAAALHLVFLLTAAAPAQAKQFGFTQQLRQNGISLKIIRLDRPDGFAFGVAFAGPDRSIVIAPGRSGRWLFQVGGDEVTVQHHAASGSMEIIQADGDILYALCIVQAVVTFFSDLTLCEGDFTCVVSSIIELVISITSCSGDAGGTTTTTTAPATFTTTAPATTTTVTGASTTSTTAEPY